MATNVTWNGVTYSIPQDGNLSWASLTNILVALGTNAAVTAQAKQAIRIATATPVTVSALTDYTVITDLSVAGAVAVNLPAGAAGQIFIIVDGKGDAATNNITITPASGTIGGSATYVINRNSQGVMIQYPTTGTDWKVLGTFIKPGTILLSADVTGTLPLVNGGTGTAAASANAAFNALAPTTTKGDLIASNGTINVRVPVGSDGQLLTADSAQASGVSWSGGALTNPMDDTGQFIVGGTAGAPTKLAHPGSNNRVVRTTSTTASGFGQIDDPGFFTDGAAASASDRGIITTGTQTVAGRKTFGTGATVIGAGSDNQLKIERTSSFQASTWLTAANTDAGGAADHRLLVASDSAGSFGTTAAAFNVTQKRLGVGTDAPERPLQVVGPTAAGTAPSWSSATNAIFQNNSTTGTSCEVHIISGTSGISALDFGDSGSNAAGFVSYSNSTDQMSFGTNGSTRVLITSGGNLGINTTSVSRALQIGNPGATTGSMRINHGAAESDHICTQSTGTMTFDIWYRGDSLAGGDEIARLNADTAGKTIAFVNASDVRLKTNFADFQATDKLKAIDVVEYEWIDNPGVKYHGVKAQQAKEHWPVAITEGSAEGPEDAENFKAWGVSYDKYIPLLMKVCKEQQAKIEELEARIASLES